MTMESNRRWVFLAVNLAVLAIILYWLRENISPSGVIGQLKAIPQEGILIALALNLAAICVYGARLSLLLASRGLPATAIVIIGFGMNGVLPFRLGEVAKLAYARQLFGIATPRLIAATAAEKLMDLSALLLLGLVASQLFAAPYLNLGITVAGILVGGFVLVLAVAFWVLAYRERSGRKTHRWIREAFDTLRAQNHRTKLVQLGLLTAIIWIITVASVYGMFNAVFPQFSLSDASVLTLVLALAIAIPSAPAGLGVVEAAIVAYLYQALQAEPNQALASALAFHLIVVIPQVLAMAAILLGGFFFRRRLKDKPPVRI